MVRSDQFYFYFLGSLGMISGMKFCDYLFYDPIEHMKVRQRMQDEYWKQHGQPKNIKPQIVDSLLRPGEKRKTWIKIVLGKDKYLSKDQYTIKDENKGKKDQKVQVKIAEK